MSRTSALPGIYAAVLIPWRTFAAAQACELAKPLEELRIALKVATGYEYDNGHFRIDFSGEEFAFSYTMQVAAVGSERDKELRRKFPKYSGGPNGSNARTLVIWNRRGHQQLYEATFIADHNEPLPKKVELAAALAMSEFVGGKVACSDCGARTEAGAQRKYFAGTYCPGCWEGSQGQHVNKGGWKAVESRETYD